MKKVNQTAMVLCAMTSLVGAATAATNIPQELSVQGVLRNGSGQLQSSAVMVTVKFFDAQMNGNQLGVSVGPNSVMATNGLFTMTIPLGNTDLAALAAATQVWMEVTAGPDTFPRSKVEPELYALVSQYADNLSPNCVGCVTDAMLASSISASKIKGAVASATSATSATNATNATNATTATNFSGALTGDVTGSQSATKVSAIGGVGITGTGATNGEVMKFNGSIWTHGPDNIGAGTVTSVATGTGLTGGPITGTGTIALTVPVSVANGGTGTTAKSWVDLTTAQDVGGAKTFTTAIGIGAAPGTYLERISNPAANAPPPVLVTANTNSQTAAIAEFRQDNLAQGVGIGYAAIFATGTNANQDLSVLSRGTGNLLLNDTGTGNVGVGTNAPGALFNVNGIGLFGTTTGVVNPGEPLQVGGKLAGIRFADRSGGSNPRWADYADAGSYHVSNASFGDMVNISANGVVTLNNTGAFNPITVAANQIMLGHISSGGGWDATGICARQIGNVMCTGTNTGQFYWSYVTSATVVDTKMQLDGATGNLTITGTLTQASSQRFKKDIHFLDQRELDDALHVLEATPVARYRYKTAAAGSKLNYGVIAEKTPSPLLSEDNQGVNLSNTVGLLMAAVKAQQARIRQLEEQQKELADLKVELRALHRRQR